MAWGQSNDECFVYFTFLLKHFSLRDKNLMYLQLFLDNIILSCFKSGLRKEGFVDWIVSLYTYLVTTYLIVVTVSE